ncbi:serpin-ZX-like [Euphorbia lathyris]|uniref:serpin-ZX-like n=1 Tax=Euphorbia lathyris TaxID=212925 RepID=UPI003313D55B
METRTSQTKNNNLEFGIRIATHSILKEINHACKSNLKEELRNEINSWAREVSKWHIDELLSEDFFSKEAILVLASALYFKGTWLQNFDPLDTRDEDFHLLNGQTVRVPFMKRSNSYNFYGSFDGFKLLKMQYKFGKFGGKNYAMYIFLPDKKDGLQELVEKFHSDPKFLLENRKLREVKLDKLWLPKLKYEYGLDAGESMIKLGLDLPFDRMKAEIYEIVETLFGVVYLSKAFQKCYIEVNEEGTIATAVTAFEVCFGSIMPCMEPSQLSFVADHPFLFMIKEEISGIPLFVGAALNPLL